MIAEDLLERGLADAAREYDVPADAVDRLREHIAPQIDDADGARSPRSWMSWRPGPRGWLALAAAAIVLLIAVPIALGGGTSTNHHTTVASPAGADVGRAAVSGGGSRAGEAARPVLAAPSPGPQKAAHGVSGGAGPAFAAQAPAATVAGTAAGGGLVRDGTRGPLPPIPAVPDRVVKTGELDLQVAKGQVSSTINRLTALATLER